MPVLQILEWFISSQSYITAVFLLMFVFALLKNVMEV